MSDEPELHIVRVSTDEDVGTFGVLKWSDHRAPFGLSCENPWLNNRPYVSCIPVGSYECRLIKSPKFGPTVEITNVTGRTHVLFHRGNTHLNTEGCILVGEYFGFINGVPSVSASRQGFAEFYKRARELRKFRTIIRWGF